ncbi:iron-containing alcohol dehydrogenase [Parageobacillus thermoglucosidasius]|uniref:long-chain-alcohol dehydrogenase n=3 Tax=Anoxybacillaceae TaxID=3120669 RepID=A0AB38R121_PARTM|nr:iron-containing alcohol dehydrogenase [Parageobacillus thermoglucosidasius]KYD16806.1 Alcohol dehydrogenase [Anoxybacillus flavithermus]AEH49398.1 Alcohol dehydrogenase [Parageobacillus thermoglucosidasius C56-YS93]ALF09440.1 lactaldehyde reductase [Parageobacillus thermoglucosidasius]ANZ29523.1 lactaldehyde reductase [Parageobacillus thermoglucosidasius]APM80261.1 lactaldehyde reductase [Parageobacillus thermoglucosidasius]
MSNAHVFYVPSTNLMGRGCLAKVGPFIKEFGFKKALVVTDKFLHKSGIAGKVLAVLDEIGVNYVVYDDVKPNPTTKNVYAGADLFKKNECDFLVSVGGGSPQDTAKAIGLYVTNGGDIRDYEGVNKTKNKSVPIVAVNTTAGTSSEFTINYVITDEERNVKMVMVDKNSLVTISVNDPELMVDKPAALTAATGMDALTHAIEAVVTPGSYTVTDATALAAIEIIFNYLPRAVKNGHDIEAREQMAYAMFLVGIAFNNAGLGMVHAMAHQLGGMYDLPHGVCNAMLLPIVERENAKRDPRKFRAIAKAAGIDVTGKTDEQCAEEVIEAIKALSREIGIPSKLSELGVDEVDLEKLANNALKDACAPGNPFQPTKEEVISMFKEIL